MNRRTTIKNLLVASGGLVTLTFLGRKLERQRSDKTSVFLFMTSQEILASVADTIIPAGNSIGALSVGVDKFLQKLIANCYEKDVQENVKTQLAALDASAKSLMEIVSSVVIKRNDKRY